MSTREVYNDTGYVPREVVGSKAFNLEYQRSISDQELYDDIVSYLGEYRLKVPKYDYPLIFSSDVTGHEPQRIRDPHKGESMLLKARRSIEERTYRNEPIHREIAEEKGIAKLEEQLRDAKTGHTILWLSPPGPKEQGYEDYAFLFKGDITKKLDGSASLAMQAIRLKGATLEQGREFFTTITGEENTNQTPEDFIADPVVLPFTIPEPLLDKALKQQFKFEADERKQKKFHSIISKMDKHIQEFIYLTKYGAKSQKLKAFYALENYALQLEKEYHDPHDTVYQDITVISPQYANLAALTEAHGYTPPSTGGSCGSSGSETKNNLFRSPLQMFLKDALTHVLFGEDSAECEECGLSSEDNHYHCPDCQKSYADETSRAPEDRTKSCACGFEFECGDTSSHEEEHETQPIEIFSFSSNEKDDEVLAA